MKQGKMGFQNTLFVDVYSPVSAMVEARHSLRLKSFSCDCALTLSPGFRLSLFELLCPEMGKLAHLCFARQAIILCFSDCQGVSSFDQSLAICIVRRFLPLRTSKRSGQDKNLR